MPFFGDGREERIDAFLLETRLMSNPEVRRRKADYERRVAEARAEARAMGKQAIIDKLIARTPAYIRDLLETEDERFGDGALVERYARTFFVRPAQAIEARRAETLGSVHESAVRQDAPETPLSTPLPSGSIER